MTRAREADAEVFVERAGVNIHYEVYGVAGPTILLLPAPSRRVDDADWRRSDATRASPCVARAHASDAGSVHTVRQPCDRGGHPRPEHDGVVVIGTREHHSLGQGGGIVCDAGAELRGHY